MATLLVNSNKSKTLMLYKAIAKASLIPLIRCCTLSSVELLK